MPCYQIGNAIPVISDTAFIAPDADIIGQVELGDGASVWFGSVLRGDSDRIVIGQETNIQDLSVLHVDPGFPILMGKRITVGHRCVVHGCTIGDDCLIGMGAVLMNGVTVGHGSIIAAGAVVLENTVIPPFSLVAGMPGVVKKVNDPSIVEVIQASARHYADRSGEYQNKLVQL